MTQDMLRNLIPLRTPSVPAVLLVLSSLEPLVYTENAISNWPALPIKYVGNIIVLNYYEKFAEVHIQLITQVCQALYIINKTYLSS